MTKGYECDKCVGHVGVQEGILLGLVLYPTLLLIKEIMHNYYIDVSPFVCVCARVCPLKRIQEIRGTY